MSSAKADVKEEVEAARAEGAAAASGDAPAAAAASTAAAARREKEGADADPRFPLAAHNVGCGRGKQLVRGFSALVGEREGFDDEEHLKALFEEFDTDKSGTVDMCEYSSTR